MSTVRLPLFEPTTAIQAPRSATSYTSTSEQSKASQMIGTTQNFWLNKMGYEDKVGHRRAGRPRGRFDYYN